MKASFFPSTSLGGSAIPVLINLSAPPSVQLMMNPQFGHFTVVAFCVSYTLVLITGNPFSTLKSKFSTLAIMFFILSTVISMLQFGHFGVMHHNTYIMD